MVGEHTLHQVDPRPCRLQAAYVGLYQMLGLDAATPLDEMPRARDHFARAGEARDIRALSDSLTQVALNWLLQQPGVTAPIIGARTPVQPEENLGSAGWMLSTGELNRLDAANEMRLPSPYLRGHVYTPA